MCQLRCPIGHVNVEFDHRKQHDTALMVSPLIMLMDILTGRLDPCRCGTGVPWTSQAAQQDPAQKCSQSQGLSCL